MKSIIFFLVVFMFIAGCQKNESNSSIEEPDKSSERLNEKKNIKKVEVNTESKNVPTVSELFKQIIENSNTNLTVSEDDFFEKECRRGIPEKSIKKDKVKFHKFILNKKSKIGEEIVILENNDSLYIQNKGCEYFWMTYSYYFKKGVLNKNNSDVHVLNTLKLLQKISDSPINFQTNIDLVKNIIIEGEHLIQDSVYDSGEETISQSFNYKVNNLKDKSVLQLDFSIGPL